MLVRALSLMHSDKGPDGSARAATALQESNAWQHGRRYLLPLCLAMNTLLQGCASLGGPAAAYSACQLLIELTQSGAVATSAAGMDRMDRVTAWELLAHDGMHRQQYAPTCRAAVCGGAPNSSWSPTLSRTASVSANHSSLTRFTSLHLYSLRGPKHPGML